MLHAGRFECWADVVPGRERFAWLFALENSLEDPTMPPLEGALFGFFAFSFSARVVASYVGDNDAVQIFETAAPSDASYLLTSVPAS